VHAHWARPWQPSHTH